MESPQDGEHGGGCSVRLAGIPEAAAYGETMALITAFASQKGGTAKTTTAASVAPLLALSGRRVLLIDLDQQADLTALYGFNELNLEYSLVDALAPAKPVPIETALRRDVAGVPGLDLLPSDLRAAGLEKQLAGERFREHKLRKALAPLGNAYDEILIDCPPSLGDITLNGLCAADQVLSPVAMMDKNAVQGAINLVRTLRELQSQGQRAELKSLIRVKVDHRLLAYQALNASLAGLELPIARTELLDRKDWDNAVVESAPVVLWRPGGEAARNIRSLVAELWPHVHVPCASDVPRLLAAGRRESLRAAA